MQDKKPYVLKFYAPRDGLIAKTHIDAEDDLDAIDQALLRIQQREAENLEGDHMLIGPGGRKLELAGFVPAD